MPLEGNVDETITGMWTFQNDIKMDNNKRIIDLGLPLILGEDPLAPYTIDFEDDKGVSFRTGANHIHSPVPGEMHLKSPKIMMKDGFHVEMPTAGNSAWISRVDTLGATGMRFRLESTSLEFVRDGNVAAAINLSSNAAEMGELTIAGMLNLAGGSVTALGSETVTGYTEVKVGGNIVKVAVVS